MEDVDVVVVVRQRAQRLRQLSPSPRHPRRRGRPVLAAGDVRVLGGRQVLLVLVRVDQPAGPGGDVDEERDDARAGGRRVRRRPGPTSAPASAPRTSAGRPRSRPTPAPRRPRAGRAPSTWCRRPGRSRRRRRAARAGAAARAPARSRARPTPAPDASRASRARNQSRSLTRQATAQSTKNATKMSSSASRESTKCRPSKHSSSPATQPSSVEPVSRRASRHITRTISEPTTAEAIRQPKGSMPKTCSPSAISHLPTSGWTIIDGSSFQIPVVVPSRICSFGLVDVLPDVAVVEHRPGVLGVVRLVERELPRRPQLPDPQEEREQR